MAKKKKSIIRVLLALFVILVLAAAGAAWHAWRLFNKPNTSDRIRTYEIIYLPTGSAFDDLMDTLRSEQILKDERSFLWFCRLKKFKDPVHPGRYRINSGMTSNDIINLLRSGLQEPVNVTFTNIRTVDQLVSRVCKKLEADSLELNALLHNEQWIRENLGLKTESVLTLFIPNTYRFNWNTSAREFILRMQTEYKRFWTDSRKEKARAINLSQTQVSILASIVQAEQQAFPAERPEIAGLYLNRLRIGMALQSDPTVIFAMGDFTVNRVLDKDKEIDSPYNTYKYPGLPPGPVCVPDISSIDAVLNPAKSKYLYMCAKEDLSGKHNFASTLEEHNRNARKYQAALNKQRVWR